MFLKVLICSLLCCALTFADEKKHFSNNWSEYTECSGQSQSPIDIVTASAQYDAAKANVEFKLARASINEKVTFENDGQTVFLWSDDFKESVKLEDDSKFILHLINYHWGGSEHSLDGAFSDGEVEFIFRKEQYSDFKAASFVEGGTLGLSVFLKEDAEKEADIPEIASLLLMTKNLTDAGSSVKDVFNQGTLSLGNLFDSTGLYYRYTGSSTVTPCKESMERFVLHKPVEVTPGFFTELRKLKDTNGQLLQQSVQRPVQSLNERAVYKSQQ